jgi:hypothetical protein
LACCQTSYIETAPLEEDIKILEDAGQGHTGQMESH